MATRIEKSRTNKRPQATMEYDEATATFSGTGKIPRLDQRGFPTSLGADTTRAAYTFVADEG